MIDGQVASTAQQVGVQRLDLDLGAPPETQEQLLNQISRGGTTAHTAADQRLHARTLGEEHLHEARAASGAVGFRLADV
jgi:hypothetical protein